ncbi:MAG TPA: DUF2807 domain-containing protein [Flavobacterium sp.]|jgi:hypothetical protein
MKNFILVLLLVLISAVGFAQKIKGSRAVTITQKEIGDFESVELSDNLEIFLVKGDKSAVEIEADDNLHDAVAIDLSAGMLRIGAAKEVGSFKKFSVRITYTSALTLVVAKGTTNITALTDLVLDNITVKTFESAKFFASVQAKKFVLMANDKSKVELNLKADAATVELSKNATLKALISATKLTFDMYQKTAATVEGDVIDMKLRLDNNANFVGKNLTAKTVQVVTEDYSAGSIIASEKAVIAAGGKSEIQLYGDPKIEITKFSDSALLQKKPTTGKVN